MPNREEVIYMAGFMDGEGCITTSHTNFRITVANTDRKILDWCKEKFGGNINNLCLPINPKHSPAWKWIICKSSDVLDFLKIVYPYMIVKKEQAKIVIDYLNEHKNMMRKNIQ